MSVAKEKKEIVIIGGGIVGVSTAYFLTRHKLFDPAVHSVTLLEATGIASGASGKAGGFLASWATPKCLAPLSFGVHGDLAREHGGEAWGYRHVYAAEVELDALQQEPREGPSPTAETGNVTTTTTATSSSEDGSTAAAAAPGWLDPKSVKAYSEIGKPGDSAQVNPYVLTTTLARLAEEAGAKILVGAVARSINYRGGVTDTAPNAAATTAVESVSYLSPGGGGHHPQTQPATDVLVAAGPWSTRLLPAEAKVKLLAPKGHSLILRPGRDLSPHILFADILTAGTTTNTTTGTAAATAQRHLITDIYPRPTDALYPSDTGTVDASGPDYYDSPLPETTSAVVVEDIKCDEVWRAVGGVSPDLRASEILTRQACYKAQIRPHEDGVEVGPMVGPLGGVGGLWLATGLDEWGIQNGPGTGLVMSEMILEGKAKSADVDSLDPKHWVED